MHLKLWRVRDAGGQISHPKFRATQVAAFSSGQLPCTRLREAAGDEAFSLKTRAYSADTWATASS